MFHTADPKNVKSVKSTDVYFTRTMEVFMAKKIDKWVKAEFIAKRLPEHIDTLFIGACPARK